MHKIKRLALERKVLFIRVAAILLPLAIALLLLSQTVSAQTTYVITDGSRVLVHTTSATDPEAVLGEAGLKLGADDTYTAHLGEEGSVINVQRSQRICIDYYGEQMQAISMGETVGQLLKRLNLSWDADDVISLPLDAQTYDGMELLVANVIRQEQTYTLSLEHDTRYYDDVTMGTGDWEVLTEGVDGEVLCTAMVTYINGKETERNVTEQRVVSQPVTEVISVGTGGNKAPEEKDKPVIGDGIITLPSGEVLTYTDVATFRATAYTHTDPGCDMITATGTTVRIGTQIPKIGLCRRENVFLSFGIVGYQIAFALTDHRAVIDNRRDHLFCHAVRIICYILRVIHRDACLTEASAKQAGNCQKKQQNSPYSFQENHLRTTDSAKEIYYNCTLFPLYCQGNPPAKRARTLEKTPKEPPGSFGVLGFPNVASTLQLRTSFMLSLFMYMA